jgi:hypothetical protein
MYRAMICFNKPDRMFEFTNEMYNRLGEIEAVMARNVINNDVTIRFKNNSEIKIILGNPITHEGELHEILFDYETNCVIMEAAQSLLTPYQDRQKEEYAVDASSFLRETAEYIHKNFAQEYNKYAMGVWGDDDLDMTIRHKRKRKTKERTLENDSKELDKFLSDFRVV